MQVPFVDQSQYLMIAVASIFIFGPSGPRPRKNSRETRRLTHSATVNPYILINHRTISSPGLIRSERQVLSVQRLQHLQAGRQIPKSLMVKITRNS